MPTTKDVINKTLPNHDTGGLAIYFQSLLLSRNTKKERETKSEIISNYAHVNKKNKSKIFLKLLARNMRSRNVTLANFLIVFPKFAFSTLDEILFDKNLSSMASPEAPYVPRSLQYAGVSPFLLHFLSIVFHSTYNWDDVMRKIFSNGKDALKAMVVVQTTLAMIQTVTEISIHNKKTHIQDRDSLERVAESLKIEHYKKMNMDQLRVSIADELIKSQSVRRAVK